MSESLTSLSGNGATGTTACRRSLTLSYPLPSCEKTALPQRLLRYFLLDLLTQRHAAGVVECGEVRERNHRCVSRGGVCASALVVHDGRQAVVRWSSRSSISFCLEERLGSHGMSDG